VGLIPDISQSLSEESEEQRLYEAAQGLNVQNQVNIIDTESTFVLIYTPPTEGQLKEKMEEGLNETYSSDIYISISNDEFIEKGDWLTTYNQDRESLTSPENSTQSKVSRIEEIIDEEAFCNQSRHISETYIIKDPSLPN
jgi:hypothetical protein